MRSDLEHAAERARQVVEEVSEYLPSVDLSRISSASSWRDLAVELEKCAAEADDCKCGAASAVSVAEEHVRRTTAGATAAAAEAGSSIREFEACTARARITADAAKAMATEAERCAKQAARCANEHGLNGAPTRCSSGHGTWDVHVAVHCLRSSGKTKPPDSMDYDDPVVASLARAAAAARGALEDARRAHHEAEETMKWRAHELEKIELEYFAAQRADEQRRNPTQHRHDAESMQRAWASTLQHLEKRLRQLQKRHFVQCAVVGFVQSESDDWRRVWTRRSDARVDSPRRHQLERCVAPDEECYCALCAQRNCEANRNGAPQSSGTNGVYMQGGDGVGTRVSGVVRISAETPNAGMDALSEQLVSALHVARPPLEDKEFRDAELAATKAAAAKDYADADARVLAAEQEAQRAMENVLSEQAAAERAKARADAAVRAAKRKADERERQAAGNRDAIFDVSWHHESRKPVSGSPQRRPFLTNPHSALVLDVQLRLLRTSGASFSYVSGRSQSDEGLNWFGIGREHIDFQADQLALSQSLRPSLGKAHGISPREAFASPRRVPNSPRGSIPRATTPRSMSPRNRGARSPSPRSPSSRSYLEVVA